ncbi:MAG TPA: TetR/AcrR family transcriptional regulator [Polyangia bacterium]|nr:TetR/AcrR family transcriptional regulator [Polyangia bacterium]
MSKTPIWAVAAPAARKPRFTREQIAATALKLADAEGFEALSMRRIAEALGAGTMTLYYYVRTKEDLLTLVEDALLGEICDACDPLPRDWRAAVSRIAHATRATYVRHGWALRWLTGMRVKPNGLRHVEQSLEAVSATRLPLDQKFEILSIVDDYVVGHCAGLLRTRSQPRLNRQATRAVNEAMTRYLDQGHYPQLRAMIGGDDPVDAFAKSSGFMTQDRHFDVGLDALLDGLARRYGLK